MPHRVQPYRSRWKLTCIRLALACLAAACGTRIDDPAQNVAGAGARDAGSPDSGEKLGMSHFTKFTLDNAGVAPVLVGNDCGGHWLSLERAGAPLLVDRSCACSCAASEICGCPAVCLDTENLLMPGESSQVGWDGVAATMAAGETCYVAKVPAEGETISAEACWNVDDATGARSCATTTFPYAEKPEVHIVAEPSAREPASTEIALENRTGGPIEVVVNHCGSQGFFDIVRKDESLSVNTFCPCACDEEYGLAGCPTCGGCAEDVVETLAQGDTKLLNWDGKFWHTYESTCQARYDMPTGTHLDARLCWTKAGETAPRCAISEFVHGQEEPVRVIAR